MLHTVHVWQAVWMGLDCAEEGPCFSKMRALFFYRLWQSDSQAPVGTTQAVTAHIVAQWQAASAAHIERGSEMKRERERDKKPEETHSRWNDEDSLFSSSFVLLRLLGFQEADGPCTVARSLTGSLIQLPSPRQGFSFLSPSFIWSLFLMCRCAVRPLMP